MTLKHKLSAYASHIGLTVAPMWYPKPPIEREDAPVQDVGSGSGNTEPNPKKRRLTAEERRRKIVSTMHESGEDTRHDRYLHRAARLVRRERWAREHPREKYPFNDERPVWPSQTRGKEKRHG